MVKSYSGVPVLHFEGGPGVYFQTLRGVPGLGILVPPLHYAEIYYNPLTRH